MKKSQVKLKIIVFILIILIVNIFVINAKTARAFSNPFVIDNTALMNAKGDEYMKLSMKIEALEKQKTAKAAQAIKTVDIQGADVDIVGLKAQLKQLEAQYKQLDKDNGQYIWTRWFETAANQWREARGAAFKAMLGNFLNNVAYDTATYLATGNEGQGPMFETRPFSKVLTDAADSSAGTFLETLGKRGPIKFNLCNPNPAVLLKISLGLQKTSKPKAPACTFSQLTKNWDAALKDKDFLPKFQDMFNPWSNDLGIALTLQTGMETEIDKQANLALENAKKEYKPVTDAISGFIKSPSSLVGMQADAILKEQGVKEKTYTGTIADAIDIFINTLAGKLMDKWLKKGLVPSLPNKPSDNLTDPNAQNQAEGIAGAENRMRSLTEPSFKIRGDYNILSELTMCPDPNKAGPTNCVIDEKFRQAIEKRLTVGQAVEQGYLNGNGVFGFTSDGLEPRFNEGYPYRSMLILRKFRILPVGWEIAAQKIKDQQSYVKGTKNLSDLVNCAQAWCAGLVDPNWVLKAPQNFCKKQGAGPEILSEEVSGEGAASSLSILRNDTYCADEQSCIKDKSDGSCQQYGYCTEERRTWDFNGKSCEPRDNTCQTFQLGDQSVSYLQNTLDFGACNAGNAGCQKYAASGSYDNGMVKWDAGAGSIYLNKNAASCEAADEGCHGFIRTLPDQSETYADIKNAGVEAAYNRFSAAGLIYEKLLPDYLKKSCYSYDASDNILDGALLANAPAECSNFVRQCKAEEAGCELYASASDGAKIPAKAKPKDYCPAECVGYDTFIQKQTNFDSSRDAYFIPKTAKTCTAEAAGCDQFTNLDEVAKGGEGVEYYTALRQCVKKSDNAASCGEFYTWEGSDESGYQLKVESLKAAGAEPAVTESDAALCDKDIYNLPPSNPAYNADCRQFYNRDGGISYHLYNRTVSCSDDCHPYRKTLAADDTAGSCAGGGVWNATAGACVYTAIPGQGAACAAAQAGCREYTGNTGNNVRNIFTDDFSGGTTGGWVGVNGSVAAPSSEAITLDSDNKGNSLSVNNSASRLVGSAVTKGKSYVVNFVAKAVAPTDLNLSFDNASGDKAGFATVHLTANWQIFQTNLTDLNHEVAAGEIFLLNAGQNFYIDSITLTEITDRYYLIKNSWQTPAACDSELDGTVHQYYMLGCGQYADRANQTHYLKNFNDLCSESAVGCELMIDTHNSTAAAAETFNNSGTAKTVPADSFTYAVYDQEKQCSAEAKGCALLGKPYTYENTTLYGDTYLKNNPDKYNTILCGADAAGCKAFTYGQGEKYFKDPGDMACEWRRAAGAGESQAWFKKKVKRCLPTGQAGGSDAGAVCLSDADCLPNVKCQPETADKPCPTDENKTLGLGGAGGRVSQPGADLNGRWAGICAAADSGCGEYLDPVSKFNSNLIFNGNFQTLASGPTDGWSGGLTQNVILEPNTVYRLARDHQAGALTISSCSVANALYKINENNSLIGPATSITISAVDYANSRIFYYKGSAAASCVITAGSSAGAVELKPVVIDYQLAQNLDGTGCNGVVDFNKGCVLFNERSQDGAGLKALNFDADIASFSAPANPAEKDSNVILKVTPDRTCDKWLACRSYIKDENGNNICFDIGLCDAVDDKGDCSSFITSPKKNQTAESLGADKISNLSGYAKAGLTGGPPAGEAGSLGGDYYPFGAMEQAGEVVNLANGGFEFYGSNGYPTGWNWSGHKSWDANVFSVINDPISAQSEGIGYAREGRAFLKLGSSYDAISEEVDVIPNMDYIITAYANTKNLKSGQAKIDILNGAGLIIVPSAIAEDLGNDWQFQVGKFASGGNSRIKIKLYSSAAGAAGSAGNFYFDDIKIRPALNSKNSWYTAQSCRLYPKTDSMSCDYYEDSGSRQKGWYGYCLEYDRAPGNAGACILWYPVDKVKGDGIEEGAGYLGKMPVYYSLEDKAEKYAEYRHAYFYGRGKWDNCGQGASCPTNYTCVQYDKEKRDGWDDVSINCVPDGKDLITSDGSEDLYPNNAPASSKDGWYPYDGVLDFNNSVAINSTSNKFYKYLCNGLDSCSLTKELFRTKLFSTKIAQTVTSVGQNKYWGSRVYTGSDYVIPNLGFVYGSDSAPFGSMVPPSPASNPYEWDGDSGKNFNQPISYNSPAGGMARLGQAYSCIPAEADDCKYVADFSAKDFSPYIYFDLSSALHNSNSLELIKRLFAQSYGIWQWQGASDNGRYVIEQNLGWNLPTAICSGGDRPAYPNDYCALPPYASNIKVNGVSVNVNLTKNGFVNLTFNTKADANQLPLVMYAVDWGDGENTTVTGVEMRDRPNADVPHSLYHLYSYWDLKAKANSGVASISCSGGECTVKPKIQIKDNWGWCSHGAAINDCSQWQSFGGTIVVGEK